MSRDRRVSFRASPMIDRVARPRESAGVRRSRFLVSILMLASVSVILVNLVQGGREKPEPIPGSSGTVVSASTASTAAGATGASASNPSPVPTLRPLSLIAPLPVGEPGTTRPEMKRWPAAGSVEVIRTVDLSSYHGRSLSGKPLTGITVVLDPGHGGIDSGCGWPVGVRDQEIMEEEVNLKVALATKNELVSLGARVIMMREDDTFCSIFYRPAFVGQTILKDFISVARASGFNAASVERLAGPFEPILAANDDMFAGIMGGSGTSIDLKHAMDIQRQYPDWLFISIHTNAAADYPDTRGLQVYYTSSEIVRHDERLEASIPDASSWQPSYQYYDDGGRTRLAQLLYNSITARVPALGNGTSSPLIDQDFAILREQNLASAMIELGFLTNSADRAALSSADMLMRIGGSIADAVYSYYCVP